MRKLKLKIKILFLNRLVPIIPEFLYDIRHPNATLSEHLEGSSHHTTVSPTTTTTIIPTTTTTGLKCFCMNSSSNHSHLEFITAKPPTFTGRCYFVYYLTQSIIKRQFFKIFIFFEFRNSNHQCNKYRRKGKG